MARVSFSLPDETAAALEQKCEAEGVSRAACLRDLVQQGLGLGEEESPSRVGVQKLSVELGAGHLALVDPAHGAELFQRFDLMRDRLWNELGFEVPAIRCRPGLHLARNRWLIRVKDIEVAQGEAPPGHLLAVGTSEALGQLSGPMTVDPTYGTPAKWVESECRVEEDQVLFFDLAAVICTQMSEVVRAHSADLLGYADTERLLEGMAESDSALVWTVTEQLGLPPVRQVLCSLLREQVSIRDLGSILEVLADIGGVCQDPAILYEAVRVALTKVLCRKYIDRNGTLHVLTVEEKAQARLDSHTLEVAEATGFLESLASRVGDLKKRGIRPLLLTSPRARPRVRRLTWRSFPYVVVLSWEEVAPLVQVNILGTVSMQAGEELTE